MNSENTTIFSYLVRSQTIYVVSKFVAKCNDCIFSLTESQCYSCQSLHHLLEYLFSSLKTIPHLCPQYTLPLWHLVFWYFIFRALLLAVLFDHCLVYNLDNFSRLRFVFAIPSCFAISRLICHQPQLWCYTYITQDFDLFFGSNIVLIQLSHLGIKNLSCLYVFCLPLGGPKKNLLCTPHSKKEMRYLLES